MFYLLTVTHISNYIRGNHDIINFPPLFEMSYAEYHNTYLYQIVFMLS